MRIRSWKLGIIVLAISAITFAGVTTSNAQDNRDNNSKMEQSITYHLGEEELEKLPAVLVEDSNHPDFIVNSYGQFTKTDQAPTNISQDEIVNDAKDTTDKTKLIIQNGDAFIKEETK